MKGLIAALGASVLIMGVWSNAGHSQSSQQELMKTCNAQAGSQKLAGDARKSFMSKCLSAKPAAATLTPQQQKMKTCNAEAGSQKLAGDARKKFMSTCLKG